MNTTVFEERIKISDKCRTNHIRAWNETDNGTFLLRSVSCSNGKYTAHLSIEDCSDGLYSLDILRDFKSKKVYDGRKSKTNTAMAIELAKGWFNDVEPDFLAHRFAPYDANNVQTEVC